MSDAGTQFLDGDAYERLMGRWSRMAGEKFLNWLAVPNGLYWLDARHHPNRRRPNRRRANRRGPNRRRSRHGNRRAEPEPSWRGLERLQRARPLPH